MSTKAKLRLRHIEDADKSKAVNVTPEPTAPKLVASKPLVADSKKIKTLSASTEPAFEGESGSAVGMLLQRGRMERDLSLQDVAQQLRIQRSYLQALETGDFDNLPGLTYAIGYVRSYSQLVGLDADKMIADFKAEAKKLQEPTQLSFPSPAPEGKVPGGALMFVGVLLAALSYGGWYYFSTTDTAVSDLTPGIPDRLAFLLEEPAIKSAEPESAAAPATTTAQAPAATAAQPGTKSAEAPVPQPQQFAVATDPAPETTSATETAETETRAEVTTANEPVRTETSDTLEPAVADSPVETASVAPAVTEPAAAEIVKAEESEPATPVSETIATTTATEETAPTAAAAVSAPTEVASVPAADPAPVPAATDIPAVPEVSRSTSQSAVDAEAAAIDSKPAPAPAASSEGPHIVISATDDSWVQVRGEDATPLLTRILRKGEAYEVPVRSGLKLFTGNAGALKISINGAEAPSLGPFGKIARNIPLDESLLTFTATD
ncbi:helix-turn-helix domain-containing protein [Nisaea sediminum]|uniref:helix-turn-helix domain-containing protein n=1 Tax=Nisaea sediminum TaxID=2775867 RepID=UPI001D016C17|nr:helix-turn-helix domain-containing protein [Nisaea sediminum]